MGRKGAAMHTTGHTEPKVETHAAAETEAAGGDLEKLNKELQDARNLAANLQRRNQEITEAKQRLEAATQAELSRVCGELDSIKKQLADSQKQLTESKKPMPTAEKRLTNSEREEEEITATT